MFPSVKLKIETTCQFIPWLSETLTSIISFIYTPNKKNGFLDISDARKREQNTPNLIETCRGTHSQISIHISKTSIELWGSQKSDRSVVISNFHVAEQRKP